MHPVTNLRSVAPSAVEYRLPQSTVATALTPVLQQQIDALLETGASVLDIGCLGWKLVNARADLDHHGCDIELPSLPPNPVDFRPCDVDNQPLPWPDDYFALVVASHIIEHLHHPPRAIQEIVRVCRPGGLIYIECPSDRSVRAAPVVRNLSAFVNFWDDPTHLRPWSPRALYRAMIGFNVEPVTTGYDNSWCAKLFLPMNYLRFLIDGDGDRLTEKYWKAVGFSAFILARKPAVLCGAAPFQYRSLKGITEQDIADYFDGLRGDVIYESASTVTRELVHR